MLEPTRRPIRTALATCLLALLPPLAGCGGDPEPAGETAPVAPVTSRGEPVPGPAAGTPAPAPAGGAALRWRLPEGWREAPPSSPMRMAEMSIPGAAGEAQLAVFHFGPGQGGGVEANLDRWVGQIEPQAGEPERGTLTTEGGLEATWIDVAGTLQPSMMGAGPSQPQPGSRLLGAVVEGPGGPWFFKATGPDATVAAARPAFLDLLRSLTPAA